jgi:ATP-dependent Clp protease ATP-binding subunit ClpX
MDGIVLKFTDDAIDYMIECALEQGLGSRGLRNRMEQILLEAMFELPSKQGVRDFVIDKEYVIKQIARVDERSKVAPAA